VGTTIVERRMFNFIFSNHRSSSISSSYKVNISIGLAEFLCFSFPLLVEDDSEGDSNE